MRTLLLLFAAAIATFAASGPAYQGQIVTSTTLANATDGVTLAIGGQGYVDFYGWNGSAWKVINRVSTPGIVNGLAIYKTSAIGKYGNGAFAFEFDGKSWKMTQSLALADGTGTYTGTMVSLLSNTAVVGAPNVSAGRGQAYVLARSAPGAPWALVQTLFAQTSNADNYGDSVKLGVAGTTHYLLVGAPMFNGAAGVVYAYKQVGVTFSIAGVIASPAAGVARFGQTLSGETASVLIGAPANLNFAGSAHLYTIGFNGGALVAAQSAMITSPGSQFFGSGLSLQSTFAVISSNATLIYYPFGNGAIGGPIPLSVPAHSTSWGFAISASSNGFIFAGDPLAPGSGGAVSWYR